MQRTIARLEPHLTAERLRRFQEVLAARSDHVTFVFERMVDPHNLSAVLRSLDAFSFQEAHMIAPDGRLGLSRGITIGAERWLTLNRHEQAGGCLEKLKERGYRIYAGHAGEEGKRGIELREIDFRQPTALVFGNEHAGVGEEVLALAEQTFWIKMSGFVESLNLSVAAAVSAFHARDALEKLLPAKPAPEGFLLADERRLELYAQWLRISVKRADEILARPDKGKEG